MRGEDWALLRCLAGGGRHLILLIFWQVLETLQPFTAPLDWGLTGTDTPRRLVGIMGLSSRSSVLVWDIQINVSDPFNAQRLTRARLSLGMKMNRLGEGFNSLGSMPA